MRQAVTKCFKFADGGPQLFGARADRRFELLSVDLELSLCFAKSFLCLFLGGDIAGIFDAPTIRPVESLTGETVSETSIRRLSLQMRTVW